MNVVVFTPTYRPGGLDVLEASLNRQEDSGSFTWIVCDELERRQMINGVAARVGCASVVLLPPPRKEGNVRYLAAAYNAGADEAVQLGADLFISMQDYLAVPARGIFRFRELFKRFPGNLYTGLTSISKDPHPKEIHDLEDQYSIFEEPYTDIPSEIDWLDARAELYPEEENGDLHTVHPHHWESNWAAVPVDFFREGLRWDEDFDRGIAYENMDFAMQAQERGASVIMDRLNHAISLPHKDYFRGERAAIEKYSNRKFFEEKWGW